MLHNGVDHEDFVAQVILGVKVFHCVLLSIAASVQPHYLLQPLLRYTNWALNMLPTHTL